MDKMMRRMFLLVLVIFLSLTLFYTGHAFTLWSKRFDTGSQDFGGLWPRPDGNYFLWLRASELSDPMRGYLHFSKLNSSGVPQWTKKIYAGDYDSIIIFEMGSNTFFVQGMTQTNREAPPGVLWAKFNVDDSNGNFTPVFQKVFRNFGGKSLVFLPTEGGDLIGIGATAQFSTTPTDSNILIMKVNPSTGDIIWSKVLHHSLQDDSPMLIETRNGYMLIAETNIMNDRQDILVAKLNASGTPQWAKIYGGSGVNWVGLHPISGRNFLLMGWTKPDNMSLNWDIILIKINENGNYMWGKKYSSDDMDSAVSLFENPDGTLILTGTIMEIPLFSTPTPQSHIFAMKLNASGEILWKKVFGGGESDSGFFRESEDGNYLLTGGSNSFSSNLTDFDVLFGKFDSNFNPIWLRTFGTTELESGSIEILNQHYIIIGNTLLPKMDVFGVILDSNGDYSGCSYIKNVTLSVTEPNITESDLNWTPTATTIVAKDQPFLIENLSLNIVPASITATDLCSVYAPTETVSIPNIPSGPASGTTGTSYSYTSGGSTSNLGHPIECQFDWKGDGSDLFHWGSATQSKTWTVAGTYNVRARARCKTDTSVVSEWSGTLSVNITSNPTLTVSKSGTGNGTVTSTPRGINCGSDCSEVYKPGTKVTLTAKADANSIFTGWSGGGCSAAGKCIVTMNADTSVTAAFSAKTPDISVSSNSLDFGNVKVKKIVSKTLKISNSGTGDLTVTIDGLSGTDFSISGSSSITIKAKKSYNLKIIFKPTSVGQATATLRLNSKDPDTPVFEVSLTGTGQ